jgi:polysaccharide export outer membrane protein
MSLPPYQIAPPDVLVIDALTVVPRPPYKIHALDYLLIQIAPESVPKDFPKELLIAGVFSVGTEGTVNLGANYQSVQVLGMTLKEAQKAILQRLRKVLKKEVGDTVRVSVELAQSRAMVQVRGQHLVRPDGTVGLGTYGSVHVAGLTIAEAKQAIEEHLSQFLLEPEISLDVAGYNSKVYYVITDGAGSGQLVIRLPITGNETVLDAIGQINGLGTVASPKHIWLARPTPADEDSEQILPVDWIAITKRGKTATNYQVLPGDRIYVDSQSIVKVDNIVAKVLAPIERIFGAILLGDTTVNALQSRTIGGTGTTP